MTMKENSEGRFQFDEKYSLKVIGTDEAGRGPGAGGVFASAVHFDTLSKDLKEKLSILNDSKQLTKKRREYLFEYIKNETINSTVCIEVEEIEKNNILNSSLKAMKRASENVICKMHNKNANEVIVLVDGNKLIKDFNYPQEFIIKGDCKSASIAAASILAKVNRDRYMKELDERFPQYGWRTNAGYLTKSHLEAIDKYGITVYHRKSFLQKHFKRQLTIFDYE
jgi:ribonuclease HII